MIPAVVVPLASRPATSYDHLPTLDRWVRSTPWS